MLFFTAIVWLSAVGVARAETHPVGVISSSIGKAFVLRGGDKLSVQRGMEVFASDQLVTLPRAVVKLTFADGSNIVAMEAGSVEIEEYSTRAVSDRVTVKSVLNVVSGKIRVFVKPRPGGNDTQVKTTNAVMGVRGTTFIVGAQSRGKTSLVVLTGKVSIASAREPEKTVLVEENQISAVTEESPPTPPVAAPEVVKREVAAAAVIVSQLPDAPPDGEAPPNMLLPPPTVPSPVMLVNSPAHKGGAEPVTIPRVIHVPEAMVVPLGAVMTSRTGLGCNQETITQLRRAAHDFDGEALVIGRELLQCPGMGSETLFWLTFYLRSQGSDGRLQDLGKWAQGEDLPLDVKTEREEAFQAAVMGDSSKILALVRDKKSYAADKEALLVLARSLVYERNYRMARASYARAKRISSLRSDRDLRIELAYLELLDEKFEDAVKSLYELENEPLTRSQRIAVARGILLAEQHTLQPESGVNDHLQLSMLGRNNEDISHNAFSAQWDSRWIRLSAVHHEYRLWNEGIAASDGESDRERAASELLAEKNLALSSGTQMNGAVGLYWAHKPHPVLDVEGRYVFSPGVWLGGDFSHRPFGQDYTVYEDEGADWMVQRVGFTTGYEELVKLSLQGILVEDHQLAMRLNLKVGLPLHRSRETSADLLGALLYEHHPEFDSQYFTPRKRNEGIFGCKVSVHPWSWLGVTGRYAYHVATQDAQVNQWEQATSRYRYRYKLGLREAASRENGFDFGAKIEIKPTVRWIFALSIDGYNGSDERGQSLVDEMQIRLSLDYFYQMQRGVPDREE